MFNVRLKPHPLSSVYPSTQMNMDKVLQGCGYSCGAGFCCEGRREVLTAAEFIWRISFHTAL